MAKGPAGEGKGATKNVDAVRNVAAQNAIRRAAKARRKHSPSGASSQRPLTRRSSQKRVSDEERQEKVLDQSVLAQTLVAQWTTMSPSERLIATAVAKAFIDAVRTAEMSRTAVAKSKVRKVWENNPALQTRVSKKELERGLRIGAAALFQAGNSVFGVNTTDTEQSA